MNSLADLSDQADRRPSVANYVALSQAQDAVGQKQEALRSMLIATLLQAANLNPDDSANWAQVGSHCNQVGHDLAAAGAFRAAILVKPDFVEALNNLAVCLTGIDAISAQRRAVQLAPHRSDLHTNLA